MTKVHLCRGQKLQQLRDLKHRRWIHLQNVVIQGLQKKLRMHEAKLTYLEAIILELKDGKPKESKEQVVTEEIVKKPAVKRTARHDVIVALTADFDGDVVKASKVTSNLKNDFVKKDVSPVSENDGVPDNVSDVPMIDVNVASCRDRLKICVEDDPFDDCPLPIRNFTELSELPHYTHQNLKKHGKKKPMPIQAQALPLVLLGRNVIGIAQTGSGKTLAFLLPAAVHISRKHTCPPVRFEAVWPDMLVLAPVRELAVQIFDEAQKLFAGSAEENLPRGIQTVCVYGGGDKKEQHRRLSEGAHIVVATPGRLIDFLEADAVSLKCVTYFVLDEADRMLDMGFHEDVARIDEHIKQKRQVLFFSATWNAGVQRLAHGFCREDSRPVRISYGQEGKDDSMRHMTLPRAREGIVQEVVVIDSEVRGNARWPFQEKMKNEIMEKHLLNVLELSENHKILVFVSRKDLADKVTAYLKDRKFKADAMHSGRSQETRLWVLDQFRRGRIRVLVCTDVLGRGIDIPSVSHVVIHEMGDLESYVHRVGRTARGRHGKGHALVFFEYWSGQPYIAKELIDVLVSSGQHVPDELRRIAADVANGLRKVRHT